MSNRLHLTCLKIIFFLVVDLVIQIKHRSNSKSSLCCFCAIQSPPQNKNTTSKAVIVLIRAYLLAADKSSSWLINVTVCGTGGQTCDFHAFQREYTYTQHTPTQIHGHCVQLGFLIATLESL